MTTMDKIILNTLINNKTVFPDRYIHKTLELYQSKGLSDEDLQYFCSLLIKDSLISEIEYQEIKDYLLQKSYN